MNILIDSDILIEVLRRRDEILIEKWLRLAESADVPMCTPVSVCELWHGARPSEHVVIQNLFDALLCVQLDEKTGRLAGDYMQRYSKSHSLELADALIAAAAVRHEASLWTRNRKHYPMEDIHFY